MRDEQNSAPEWTVGSLAGLPLGSVPPGTTQVSVPLPAAAASGSGPRRATAPPPELQEGANWAVSAGDLSESGGRAGFRPDDVEALTYNNPFGQNMERVWSDRKLVFAVDVGEVDIDPGVVKVAQEYQIVYSIELDEVGKRRGDPPQPVGQYNIYDSVPGMDKYSPIWQFNYVVVPRDYKANTLRSERDCLDSGYQIVRSNDFEN